MTLPVLIQGSILAIMYSHLSCFLQEAIPPKNCLLNWYYGCLLASWDHVSCGVPDDALCLITYIPMWTENIFSLSICFRYLKFHVLVQICLLLRCYIMWPANDYQYIIISKGLILNGHQTIELSTIKLETVIQRC